MFYIGKSATLVLLKLFVTIFFITTIGSCGGETLMTDSKLVEQFNSRQEAYQRVVDLFYANNFSHFEISKGSKLIVRPKSSLKNTKAVDELHTLLKEKLQISLVKLKSRTIENIFAREIAFFHSQRGFVFSGESKGLVFVDNDEALFLVDQLDKVNRTNKSIHGKRLYMKVEDHWYIFFEYSP